MILGIDTSTDVCALGLAENGKMISDYRFTAKYRHAERLPVCIDHVLDDAGISHQQITGVAVSIGPGSFTGLRIGLAMAKGLAFGWDKPLLTVPTMEGLLSRVPEYHKRVCILLSARKMEYYRGLFSRSGESWHKDQAAGMVKEAELGTGLPEKPFLFFGEGVLLIRKKLSALSEYAQFMPDAFNLPSGFAIASLGEEKLSAGDVADIGSASPDYMQRFQGVE